MNKAKSLFATAVLTLSVCVPANAENTKEENLDYKPYPHMFVGVQGGIQTTFTDYNNAKLITPTTSLNFGAFFTPVVGARLHVNGIWNKGGFNNGADFKYDYKYATTDLDLMLNLVTLFGRKNYYPVNAYLIGGVGLNTAWDNDDAYSQRDMLTAAYDDTRFTHNARVGAMLDINVHKNVSVNLEVAANSLGDRFNSKLNNRDDWQLTAQVGLAFKFGYKKKPVAEEQWATRTDTIWYDDSEFVPRIESGKTAWNVFYQIRESDFTADEQLAAIGAFLADHRECKIDIKSYADVQTGNPRINMMYSKLRSEKAVKALVDAGVDKSQITANYYGDTIQPFAENDKNRVSIITVTGLKDVKDKKAVKRFRTKEVRYRVK